MIKMIVGILLLHTFLYAKPVITPEVKNLLKEAKTTTSAVDAAKTKELIANGKVVLIDVRNPDEWEKGVIKADKLIKISRGWLEIKYSKLILNAYAKNDHFIVYCGIEPRAVLAASRLKELGFTNVSYLQGGIKNWVKIGYETTK